MSRQRYLWLLDAGHAPMTPGKRSPAFEDGYVLREWEFNRRVVDAVASALSELGIAYHVLTPSTDFDMSARSRAIMANDVSRHMPGPCRLVSVHANAHGDGSDWTEARGTTTLHSGMSAASSHMAEVFQAQIAMAVGSTDRGVKERPNLAVLRATEMPAVLTECAFYTNQREANFLRSRNGVVSVSAAHVVAISELESEGI